VSDAFIVAKGARSVVRNVRQLAGVPSGVEDGNRRTIEESGRRRIGRPFRTWQLKPPRASKRGIFDIAGDRNPMRPKLFVFKAAQELIGQRDLESMLATAPS
jgi:hypothetical protein